MSNSRIVYQNWIVDLGHDTMEQLFDNSRIYKTDEYLEARLPVFLELVCVWLRVYKLPFRIDQQSPDSSSPYNKIEL